MTALSRIETLAEAKARIRGGVREKMRTVIRPDSRFVYQLENMSPDFPGSEVFPRVIMSLPFYKGDNPVYITPDNCGDHLRTHFIKEHRPLMATVHIGLGYHFFAPGSVPAGQERFAGTLDGGLIFGANVDLEYLMRLPRPDFYVTGCGAINRKGARWGKGHGYGDVHWAIFNEAGLVDQSTPVVVCTHDFCVVDDEIPLSDTDLTADWIITPKQVIEVKDPLPKPSSGVNDSLLSAEFAEELALPLAQLRKVREDKMRKSGGAK